MRDIDGGGACNPCWAIVYCAVGSILAVVGGVGLALATEPIPWVRLPVLAVLLGVAIGAALWTV